MRKRKRSNDPQNPGPRSKRPTLLLLPKTPPTQQSTKCGKLLSKSDPISPKETRDLFAKKTRTIHSDTDLIPENRNRIRHTSAGEFNESD